MSRTASHGSEFFDELARRGHEPLLERVRASIRFEITDDGGEDGDDGGDQGGDDGRARTLDRLVTIDRGDLHVSTDQTEADAVVTCSGAELDDLVTGRTSAMASLLRGTLAVRGDLELMVLAQRLFSRNVVAMSGSRSPVDGGRSS